MIPLIKEVFLPERIETYYLFSKYVIGVVIGKTNIIATKTRLQGNKTTIELILEEKIDTSNNEEQESDRIARALKSLFSKIGKYDEVITVLPSSLVIFKELRLPFLQREKINLVIGFEIEPLLPFPLRDAVVDFVITRQIPQDNSSEILVTAVQKQHVAEHLTFFELANIKVDKVTVDMISLYSLYAMLPTYNTLQGGVALIDLGLHTTRIAIIVNSQLKMIRTLPKGFVTLTKKAAHDLNTTPNDIMEKLIRFGLDAPEQPDYETAIRSAANTLWDDILFTFTSFSSQFLNRNSVAHVIVLGEGSLIKGLLASLSQKIQIPCQEFQLTDLSATKIEVKKDCTITPVNLISVSATIPSSVTLEYNLEHAEFVKPNNKLLIIQLIILIILSIGLFASLITHYSLQKNKLSAEVQASEQEALKTLKNTFKTLEDEKILNEAIEEAEREVEKQQETWFAFSNQSRGSFLQYLLELTSKIDTKSTGFEIEQLSFSGNELILKGRVKDFDALKILERELGQSPLFSYIEPQENLQFTMKITLARNSDDNS